MKEYAYEINMKWRSNIIWIEIKILIENVLIKKKTLFILKLFIVNIPIFNYNKKKKHEWYKKKREIPLQNDGFLWFYYFYVF